MARRRAARARDWRSCAAARRRRSRCPPRGSQRAAARTAASSSGCNSAPSGSMRPPTSKMCSGGTGRFGFTQANRLARRGTSWRPISSTYLKPVVVMRAAGAPLPSRIRLVAMVVPCSTRTTSAPVRPAVFSTSTMPSPKPRDGSSGVDGVLAFHDPARGRIQQRDVGERAAGVDADDDLGLRRSAQWPSGERRVVAVTVEELGVRPPGAPRPWWPPHRRCRPIIGQHDAVVLRCALPADEAAAHVGEHALGLAVERMAPPAAAAGLDAQRRRRGARCCRRSAGAERAHPAGPD